MTLQLNASIDTPFVMLASGAIVKVIDVTISTRAQTVVVTYGVYTTLADLQADKEPVIETTFIPTPAQVTNVTTNILTRAYAALQANLFPGSTDLGLAAAG